jgi:adenosylcobinamide-GDP ribazoletransferase
MNVLSNLLTKFIHTASYVTIIPLARLLPASAVNDDSLKGLAIYLPAVGAMLGGILACTCLILEKLNTPNLLLATIITILWLTLTGGLHFDGLMDTADGIFSHRSKERMLEIMQDSRVGNFAVMVGIANFVLKVAALTALSAQMLPALLLFAPCLARLAETFAIGAFPYARAEGKGKVWHDTMRFPKDIFGAALVPISLLIGCTIASKGALLLPGALYFATACSIGIISAAYLNNRLGGHTGDTYGAVVELTETLTLTIAALAKSAAVI